MFSYWEYANTGYCHEWHFLCCFYSLAYTGTEWSTYVGCVQYFPLAANLHFSCGSQCCMCMNIQDVNDVYHLDEPSSESYFIGEYIFVYCIYYLIIPMLSRALTQHVTSWFIHDSVWFTCPHAVLSHSLSLINQHDPSAVVRDKCPQCFCKLFINDQILVNVFSRNTYYVLLRQHIKYRNFWTDHLTHS